MKVNVAAVYQLIREKKLIGLQLGSLKVRGSDLEQFIEKHPAVDCPLVEAEEE